MTVWSHLSTIFSAQRILPRICLSLIGIVFITILLFTEPLSAASSREVINFSARLKNTSGSVIPDGYYNVSFRLYTQETGGSPIWTEIYHDSNGTSPDQDSRVKVVNGYLNVKLGSLQAFGDINWNDSLWLTMNIGGTAQEANTGQIAWDGEMSPRVQLSAVPYAMNSTAVGGKTADQLAQLGQGIQQDSSNNASIGINKTGSGNLIHLQSNGIDTFTLGNSGSISLGSTADQTISINQSSSGAGKSLSLAAGSAAALSGQEGGNLILQGGNGDGSSSAGSVIVKAADDSQSNAFEVQDTAGSSILSVNTSNRTFSMGSVQVGSALENDFQASTGLWGDSAPSSGTAKQFGSPVNLGTVFKSSKAGIVTGVRFYNPDGGNISGSDTGKIWSCIDATCDIAQGGTEIASVTFAQDTTAGWKTAYFSTPVTITPNTYYVVSHYSPSGHYYSSTVYFDGHTHHSDSLTSPSNSITKNGRISAGNANFPSTASDASNFWVDIVFQQKNAADTIVSNSDMSIGSVGSMTIGPTDSPLTLQGSDVTIEADTTTISGDTVVTSKSNSTSLFQVQNANNDTLVNIDSVNNRLTIGSPNTTGMLLVLDSKTTSGDPNGTNGAMYYNSADSKFRCFEGGKWTDCITPLPVSKVAEVDTDNSTTSPIDVNGMEFTLAANTKYYYKFVIIHETTLETTGIGFGITTPTNTKTSNWCVNTTSTLTSATPGHWGSYCGIGDAATTTSGAENLGTKYTSTMEGYLETGNDTGAMKLRMKSETTDKVTIKTGSFSVLQIVQ